MIGWSRWCGVVLGGQGRVAPGTRTRLGRDRVARGLGCFYGGTAWRRFGRVADKRGRLFGLRDFGPRWRSLVDWGGINRGWGSVESGAFVAAECL